MEEPIAASEQADEGVAPRSLVDATPHAEPDYEPSIGAAEHHEEEVAAPDVPLAYDATPQEEPQYEPLIHAAEHHEEIPAVDVPLVEDTTPQAEPQDEPLIVAAEHSEAIAAPDVAAAGATLLAEPHDEPLVVVADDAEASAPAMPQTTVHAEQPYEPPIATAPAPDDPWATDYRPAATHAAVHVHDEPEPARPVEAAAPEPDVSSSRDVGAEAFEPEPGFEDSESIGDSGSGIEDPGLGIQDQRSGMRDSRSLGPLATWVRFEAVHRESAERTTSDELRDLMAHLALPPSIAGISYARGCRIRRVRVPGGRERRKGATPGPVILSRKALDKQRREANA